MNKYWNVQNFFIVVTVVTALTVIAAFLARKKKVS